MAWGRKRVDVARGLTFSLLGLVSSVVCLAPTSRTSAAPASAGVTLTSSPSSLAPGSKVTLTAATPVAGVGTISQEITQTIDPTKVKLTSLDDITYPTGWSLTFSTDGTNFSSTVPANAAAWAAVRAVKAAGSVVSQGDSNGKQIAVGSSTQPLVPPGGSFMSSSPGSDPWTVAFEDDGRVFVQVHHKYGGVGGLNNGAPVIKCFTRAAATCTGWSSSGYTPGAHTALADFASGYDAVMWIDGPNNRLWFPTWGATASSATGWKGFGCVDITPGAAPSPCNVSGLTTGYITFGAYTASVTDIVMGATAFGGRLFGFDVTTGSVLCANVSVVPFGPCWEGSWSSGMNTVPAFSGSYTNTNGGPYWGIGLKIIANKLWVFAKSTATGAARLACLEPSTGAFCSGWSAAVGDVPGTADLSTKYNMGPVMLPNSSGVPVAVCGQGTSWACWTLAGASYPVPTNFATRIPQSGAAGREPITVGSKIYSNDGGGYVRCYDVVTDAACAGFPATGGIVVGGSMAKSLAHYTLQDDPLNPGCFWYADDSGIVGTFNGSDGGTCVAASPRLVFGVNTLVPRLGCSASSAVGSWGTLTLTSPSSSAYTSASVDVLKDGAVVATRTLTSGAVDLSNLSVATTGQTPTFQINFTGLTGSPATGAATITAIGDAPELCLTPTVLAVCPSGVGKVDPATLLPSSTTVVADGSTTPGGALTGDTKSLTILAPTMSVCSGSLNGRAGTATLGTTGDAIVGLTVTLLDSSGNVLLDASSNPITTTTDSSGNYSFGDLLPANYKVRFPDSGTTSLSAAAVLSSVTVATGGSGTILASSLCPTGWTFDSSNTTCVRTVTATNANVGAPVGAVLSYLVVGGGGGGAAFNAAGSRGGAGGQVVSGSATVTGTVSVTIGSGGAAGASGTASSLAGGVVASATGGSGGGGSSPAGAGTSSSLTGASVAYGVGGTNWGGVAYTSAGGAGTANRGNGGGAGWRSYEGAGCYEPGAGHVYVSPGGPCGVGGTYENGGWSTIQPAGAGGSGVVVLRYPVQIVSNAATVPLGGAAVVNGLYIANPIANANTSTGMSGAVQTISVLADDTASSGATYSGGSTALKLCSTGQTSPNCTATSVSVNGQGTYAVSGTNITFTPCSANNVPAGIGCTGAYGGTATAATYQSTDSLGRTASSTVTPTVVPLPTAAADTGTGAWDVNQTFTPTANDSAGAGSTLVTIPSGICLNTVTLASSCTSTTLTIANQGTYTLNVSTGVVTFDPLPTFTGTATAIKYAVADSLGQKSLGTITPTVTPPPAPVATPDTSTGIVGAAQTVTPFANDTTPTGLSFTASSVKLCSSGQTSPSCTATSLVVAGKGTYAVNATTGVITFTPCSASNVPAGASCTGAFTGSAGAVTYQVTDSLSRVASSTYTPTVVPLPTAVADTGTGAWDVNQVFTPTSNDSAGTGSTLVAIPTGICLNSVTLASSCTSTTLTVSNQGTYTLNPATGEVTFDPLPSFTGIATPIKYAVADALGQKSLATITPTVTPPSAPVATAETKQVIPGSSVAFTTLTGTGGLASTGGPAFTTSATCLINTAVTPNACVTSLTIAGEGTYTVNTSTGVVTFAALANATSGTKTPVTYRVTDATGQTATSTLTPTIPAPPVARNDSAAAEQNNALVFNVASNDSASSPAILDATSVRLCPAAATSPYTASNCNATTLDVSNQGRYSVNIATGEVTFTPCTLAPASVCPSAAIYNGTATAARYVIADNLGQVANATIAPTLLPPPATSAANDTGTAGFAQSVVINPLTNDSGGSSPSSGYTSVGTATLVASSVRLCGVTESAPSCTQTSVTTVDGTYTVNTSTGEVTFVPATNFVGTATVSPRYMVCNQMGGTWAPVTPSTSCATASITPTILSPTMPVAANDTSSGNYNTPQVISILSNDTKDAALSFVASSVKLCGASQTPPNCSLTTLAVANEGTYVVDPSTGQVTFTPLASFSGTVAASARYQVADSRGIVVNATITPTVNPPTSPTASPEMKNVTRGAAVNFTNVVGSSALASGSGLKTGVSGGPCLVDPADNVCKDTVSITGQGAWVIDRVTGVPTFTAAANAPTGSQTALTYRVTDAVGQVASSTLTPVVPAAGSGVNDSSVGGIDVNQVISVTTNDIADTGATFVNSTLKLCGTSPVQTPPSCDKTTLSVSGEGTYTVNGDGTITFDPLPSFTGSVTPMRYQVSDSNSNTVDASISIIVTPAPAAVDDTSTGQYDTNQTITPLSNDTSSPGYPLGSIKLCGSGEAPNFCTQSSVTVSGEGTYSVNGSGVVTFDPLPSFVGAATALRYQAKDSLDQFVDAYLTPTVNPPPPPTATAEAKTVLPGASATFTNVVGLSGLGSGTGLKTGVSNGPCLVDPSDLVCKTTFAVAGEGTWAIDQSTGVATFAALSSAPAGNLTAVSYRIADAFNQVATSTLTPTVPPAPMATDDSSSGKYDTNQTISPLGNDTADALTPLDKTTLKLCGAGQTPSSCDKTTVTVAGEGTYVVNADGTVTFDPLPTFIGTATPLRYQVSDAAGRVANALLKPVVASVPSPKAQDDLSSGLSDVNQTFVPYSNDTADAATPFDKTTLKLCGADQSPPSCDKTSVTVAGEGTYVVNADGTVTFDPLPTFVGAATSVRYQVGDVAGRVAEASLKATVSPPPVAQADSSQGEMGERQVVSLTGNDAPGAATQPLDLSSIRLCGSGEVAPACSKTQVTVAGEGTYAVNGNGTVDFVPDPKFAGTAKTIPYVISDVLGQRVASTLTVIVVPPPAPIAVVDLAAGRQGETLVFSPWLNDSGGEIPAGVDGTVDVVRTSIRLCGAGETVPRCTQTSLTTTDGTYTVDMKTGKVTFVHAPGFVGSAQSPPTYQISNDWKGASGSKVASSVLIPTILPPPTPDSSPVALPDTSQGRKGKVQTIPVLGNDAAASSSLDSTTVRLCAVSESVPKCTATSLTVAGEGTYSVGKDGAVTFTPEPMFLGTATPQRYVVADKSGKTASSTVTPRVLDQPVPAAVADTGRAKQGSVVTLSPWLNDDAGGDGTSLVPTSIRLCGPGESVPNCTKLRLATVDGVYTVDPKSGKVTFVHKAGFTGEVTEPVNYQIANNFAGDAGPGYAVGVLKPEIFASSAKVLDQVNWTTPSTPVWLSPTFGGKPSKRSVFKMTSVKLKVDGELVDVVSTSEGKWEVIRGQVRFTPRDGFVGRTEPVSFVVSDTAGAIVGATLRVTVDANFVPHQILPATGRDVSLAWFAATLLVVGIVLRRLRRRRL